MTKQRLSKVLAAAGVASRRKCEELIFDGLVTVDGQIVKIPQTMVDPKENKISYHGKIIKGSQDKLYFMLNKPKGFLCTSLETEGQKSVLSLFGNKYGRLFTLGRLDKDTTGLLLVTNDGHFAQKVIHPSHGIEKEYIAKSGTEISADHLKTISKGCFVEGTWIKPLNVTKVRKGTVKVTVSEGRKREVRILLTKAGLDILELKRIRIGSICLGSLPEGHFRPLKKREIEMLLS